MTETLKLDKVGYANDICTRTGCLSPTMDRSVRITLTPRESAIHKTTVMPSNCEGLWNDLRYENHDGSSGVKNARSMEADTLLGSRGPEIVTGTPNPCKYLN
ncbi:hypothetical protein CRG98_015530 [Punica granatum]|uniref:Uncharacterized protein n=1 Tax=Punica granatum TaxID=22663 RepID=A0A2I0K8P8_PUNGR|nr:hypothetical protein CRG98_015530 [Punica granatum]